MDAIVALHAQIEISNQIKRFYMALDERDADALAAVIAPDGCWRRAGVDHIGPDAMRALIAERAPDRHSRHVLSNIVVDVLDERTATVRLYNTAFVHTGATGERGAAPMDLPSSIGILEGKFVHTGGAWLLKDLRSKPAFKRGITV
ncbi:hypothetical protein GCM10011360_41380 [Primorskyibacter flagellatus]|uniref:SnoaL-like domain-containing protein n=1 Tax=Primorskyibacter flagellatus TaxID=1387277 RepID=A0A917AGV5_9RHOB|nr:nuclear transport factor 2 family protein [Primorskyibacter flagellatus]GGE50086.1 hypothetical protein GCM10011360_41380 [Primorskyibacter flagellatus]